jgi:hypothetical protein
MKTLLSLLVTAFLLNLFLPWWSIALAGLLVGFLTNEKAGAAFGWGFLALFLLWSGQAFYINIANDGVLTGRIATMLNVGSPYLVILATGIVGGIVGGLATMTGALFNQNKSRR